MPSDCQCSACACETRIVKECIGSKKAMAMIEKLEKEVEKLKAENDELRAILPRLARIVKKN